jgi:hypothetical protein
MAVTVLRAIPNNQQRQGNGLGGNIIKKVVGGNKKGNADLGQILNDMGMDGLVYASKFLRKGTPGFLTAMVAPMRLGPNVEDELSLINNNNNYGMPQKYYKLNKDGTSEPYVDDLVRDENIADWKNNNLYSNPAYQNLQNRVDNYNRSYVNSVIGSLDSAVPNNETLKGFVNNGNDNSGLGGRNLMVILRK